MSRPLENKTWYEPTGEILEPNEVVPYIRIENPNQIPTITILAGPGRSGTTGMLLLALSQRKSNGEPLFDRGFYQPIKSLIRRHTTEFVIPEATSIFVKETFGPTYRQENFDPIDILKKAGIPQERMRMILIIRHPLHAAASWYNFTQDPKTPERFALSQSHTINLYHQYAKLGLNPIPFVYDLLYLGEEGILSRLYNFLELPKIATLFFDFSAIDSGRLVKCEAENLETWQKVFVPTLDRGKFSYNNRPGKKLPDDLESQTKKLCFDDYLSFLEISAKYFNMGNEEIERIKSWVTSF